MEINHEFIEKIRKSKTDAEARRLILKKFETCLSLIGNQQLKMAKYKWNCDKCPSTIVHNEKEEPNQLIAEFFCPICKEKKRICFKDLKENETN